MRERPQTELFCEWLENYLDYEHIKKKDDFSLEPMRFLAERFKHPERSFKSIHVAGSKGKGSVSTMMASIMDAAGINAGLYTSPHLLDFKERVSSSRGTFSEEIYGKACDIVVPLIESIIPGSIPGGAEPSWFEIVTLFAFITFREAGLPWAVIETGLGGRLDATNVILPEACVLTPIELEHTEYLGNTIEKIAGEKAGIIKKGIPVFVSEQTNEALSVFALKAEELNAPFFCMKDAIKTLSAQPSVHGLDIVIAFNNLPDGAFFTRPLRARLSLVNSVQAQNAAIAAYTMKYLFPDLAEETIESGLSRAWLPGRFEILDNQPPIILDGAHTIRSISLTVKTFTTLYPGKNHLVFACAADKAVDEIAQLFKGCFSHITVTRPGDKKQSDLNHASNAFARVFTGQERKIYSINENYVTAIQEAISTAREAHAPLLVTGSFYLVAEAKKILASLTQAPEN